MNQGKIIIVVGPKDEGMRARVKTLIAGMIADGDRIEVVDDRVVPDTWDNVVILFLANPSAFGDATLPEYLNLLAAAHFPILPVVKNLKQFRFRDIPAGFERISERNAKGLNDKKALIEALRENLGLASRERQQSVFISYRRSDAEPIAKAVHKYLKKQGYAVFLDTASISGGEVVQEAITEDLRGKDFVLFLDSPEAAASQAAAHWINEELYYALMMQIPIAVVRTKPPESYITLPGPVRSMDWRDDDPKRLEKAFRLVSRGIGRAELAGRTGRPDALRSCANPQFHAHARLRPQTTISARLARPPQDSP